MLNPPSAGQIHEAGKLAFGFTHGEVLGLGESMKFL